MMKPQDTESFPRAPDKNVPFGEQIFLLGTFELQTDMINLQ